MEQTAERWGVPVTVLEADHSLWQNREKFTLTRDYLDQCTTEYVIGLDSADVVLTRHPDELVQDYRQHYDVPLIMSATGAACWPPLPEFIMFESTRPEAHEAAGRHWLNTGCWIGRTEFCREYFAAMAQEPPVSGYEFSDQAVCKRSWPHWYPEVQLDYRCRLFGWFGESRSLLGIQRPMAERQNQLIAWLGQMLKLQFGVEVGVFDGSTSDQLLQAFPQLHLWMVDPWKPFEGEALISSLDQTAFEQMYQRALFWTEHALDRRHILRTDSLTAASSFPDHQLDFVFIDANHLYESVAADLRTWWEKIRPGGYLCGHDYGVYGDATGAWGVKRAVDEFAAEVDQQPLLGADGMWRLVR